MALKQFIGTTLNGPISAVRRQATGIAVAVAAAIGALFYFMAAANVALESMVGPVASRAIIGGSFLVIAMLSAAMPRMFRNESMVERAKAETKEMTRDEKFALIVEAILAGFSLSSSRRSRTAK